MSPSCENLDPTDDELVDELEEGLAEFQYAAHICCDLGGDFDY